MSARATYKRLGRLLCLLGRHDWPRWTRAKRKADGPGIKQVRICRRCRKRQTRPYKAAEAREAGLRG